MWPECLQWHYMILSEGRIRCYRLIITAKQSPVRYLSLYEQFIWQCQVHLYPAHCPLNYIL